ncbi:MAG: hypothetical protein C0483_15265 [Pirellula sp.]|nr:hypothetical protein [Pirellula sp.]
MNTTLKIARVEVFSLARIQAAIALMGSLVWGAFLWLDPPRPYSALFYFVQLPFLCTIGGFISGGVTALFYNLAAMVVGGVECKVVQTTEQTSRERYLTSKPIVPQQEPPAVAEPGA